MTKNRKHKRATRAAARTLGVNYTTVLRDNEDQPYTRSPFEAEPPLADRFRTNIDWADLLVDGRNAYNINSDPIPNVFGYGLRDDNARGSFVCLYPDTAMPGMVTVEGYALGENPDLPDNPTRTEAEALRDERFDAFMDPHNRVSGKPGVVIRVTYPDGHTIGYMSPEYGDYDTPIAEVWATYTE